MPVTKDRRFYLLDDPQIVQAFPWELPNPAHLDPTLRRLLKDEEQRLVAEQLLGLMHELGVWAGVLDAALDLRTRLKTKHQRLPMGLGGLIAEQHIRELVVEGHTYLVPAPEFAHMVVRPPRSHLS